MTYINQPLQYPGRFNFVKMILLLQFLSCLFFTTTAFAALSPLIPDARQQTENGHFLFNV